MNKLVKVLTGSRLYGTHTESSDYDFRGVFVPTLRECYTQTVKESIEVKEGNDETWYSIQKFLDLASTGQPVAIEMLYAGQLNQTVYPFEYQHDWYYLVSKRHQFLTKKMSAFLGFAKSLSNKYAVKTERLVALDSLIDTVGQYHAYHILHYKHPNGRLSDIWNRLPLNEFYNKETDSEGRTFYVVLSRKYRDNTLLKDFITALTEIKSEYGKRVQEAKEGKYDTKSVSHSFRICYQLQQIAKTGDLKFPLDQAEFLRDLKQGKLTVERDDIFNKLYDLMNETETMLEKSSLPNEVDKELKFEILDRFYEQ